MTQDPYSILGVSPSASDDEVKKTYRKLAMKYHPDANPGDKAAEAKMKEINAAYDAITNKDKVGSRHTAYSPYTNTGYGGSSSGGSSYGGGSYRGTATGGYGTGGYGAGGYGGYGQQGYGGFDPFDPFGWGQAARGGSGGWPFGGYSSTYSTPELRNIWSKINDRRFPEALTLLNAVDQNRRNAEWYYLSALAHEGLGDTQTARSDAERACNLDPNNLEYLFYYQKINGMGGPTESRRSATTTSSPFGCTGSMMRWFIILIVINLLLNLAARGCSAGFIGA